MACEVLPSRLVAAELATAEAGKWLAAGESAVMVKRIAPVRLVGFCLLVAGGALCQSGRPTAVRLQGVQFEDTKLRQPRALPDAPSQVVLTQTDRFQRVGEEARLPLTVGMVGMNAGVVHETHAGIALPEAPSATMLYQAVPEIKRADAFFSKYLDASHKQNSRYQLSSSDKVMGRATDAASRIFVTRDESGKRRLNTPYFLRVLTSVAADSASRRYRARSGAAPLSDFGSTVGNDAGMNLLHEFGPGIRQKVANHMPEFAARIAERISRHQNPR